MTLRCRFLTEISLSCLDDVQVIVSSVHFFLLIDSLMGPGHSFFDDRHVSEYCTFCFLLMVRKKILYILSFFADRQVCEYCTFFFLLIERLVSTLHYFCLLIDRLVSNVHYFLRCTYRLVSTVHLFCRLKG